MNSFCSLILLRGGVLLASLLLPQALRGAETRKVEAGFFIHQFDLTLESGRQTEITGPFFYSRHTDSAHTWAVPPLMSSWHDPGADAAEFDFLYPLLSVDRFGEERRWHFFQLLSIAGGQNQEQTGTRRFTIFPFYFQQRSDDPKLNYTAVLPIYGTIQNRLFRSEVRFVTPLYIQSRKNDIVTDNYFFPFFHLRRGNALAGWQLWPLYGEEHRAVTTRTNVIEELEVVGGHDKYSVLWFLFNKQTTGIGTENPEHRLAVLPLFSLQRSPERDATTVVWPFFTVIDDRAQHYREWQMPWPFVAVAQSDQTGEGKAGWRFWPFYGDMHTKTVRRKFFMYPLMRDRQIHSAPLERDRVQILFFIYSDLTEKNTVTGQARRRTDLWPLFTAQRDLEGNERFQMFALLEPVLPAGKSIERNYSPLWSLWRSEKNARTGARSESFLWNLYRAEATPDSRKCSLLFGLFKYQSDRDGSRWRLFYAPGGRSQQPAQPPASSGLKP